MSSETPLVTPKKEDIFIDVTPSSEENEQTSINSNNSCIHKNRSISLSSSSPTMSTVSSMSSNYLSLGSFKEPTESKERLYQHKRHSISFDFRDSNQKPKSQSLHCKNGSQIIFRHSSQNLIYQNENTSSSTDSNVNSNKNQEKTKICDEHLKNKDNYYAIQNSSSPKQQLDVTGDHFQKRSEILMLLYILIIFINYTYFKEQALVAMKRKRSQNNKHLSIVMYVMRHSTKRFT